MVVLFGGEGGGPARVAVAQRQQPACRQLLAAGGLLAGERKPLVLQLGLHPHLLQLAAEFSQARERLSGFRVEPLDLGLRLGARGLGLGAQLRHGLLADIAGGGLGGDLDLGELRTPLDAVSLLHSHLRAQSSRKSSRCVTR